ncbi:aromatic-ring hydroxylase C-terminal domain-containing protein [Nocardia sp. IBHARD005]
MRNDLGFRALLIRPDGFAAWAGDAAPDRDEFARAAAHWFSRPVQ